MTAAVRIDCSRSPASAELVELPAADADALAAAQADATAEQTALDQAAANAAQLRDRARLVLGNLENAASNWPTITALQKDQATLLAVRAVARLIRLVISQLDQAP